MFDVAARAHLLYFACAAPRLFVRLPYRIGIVEIARRLRQQKHRFMRLRGPVAHALGHGVRFRPDDLAAQPPTIALQREREAPGHAAEVFGLEAGDDSAYQVLAQSRRAPIPPGCGGICGKSSGAPFACLVSPRVAIPHIHPARAVMSQHPLDLSEHLNHVADIALPA